MSGVVVLLLAVSVSSCIAGDNPQSVTADSGVQAHGEDELTRSSFPKGFLFAVASAAYQVEGAWNESGKSENIWDRLTHTRPDFVRDHKNGDVACDSYHKFKEDIRLIKQIGFDVYRFSISWSRILPTGEDDYINQAGVDYYNQLIDELLRNGIQPMVTMYHWDLPQRLQNFGGWLNPIMADYFESYARVLYKLFGSKVQWWITINEPSEVAAGYRGLYAPAIYEPGVGSYLAAHTLIRAHSKAYHLYNRHFRSSQNGRISLSLCGQFPAPKDPKNTSDVEASERLVQFVFGWFAHPVYSKSGDYPPVMRERIDKLSALEGRSRSRLPTFTQEEIKEIRGTFDFFGLNHYTTSLASMKKDRPDQQSYDSDIAVQLYSDPSWPTSASDWLKVVPWGMRRILNWIKKEYNNVPVFITENGYSDNGSTLMDENRINYYQSYLSEVRKAISIDGCFLWGYSAWSIIDNFEWSRGYTERFGLYHVDFSDPARTRTAKKSVKYFQGLLKNRTVAADNFQSPRTCIEGCPEHVEVQLL